MFFTAAFALAAALSGSPAEPLAVPSLVLEQLGPGQRFEITAGNRVLRGTLTDPATGECTLSITSGDGRVGPAGRIWLLGATQGNQGGAGGLTLVLMHQVKLGMRVELGVGGLAQQDRQFTEPVTSIVLLPAEPGVAAR